MDPVTLAAISATVGGASGKLVEKAWESGERWITGYYRDHEQQALEQAKSNSLQFLADLAHRVGRLEEEAAGDATTKRQIETALGDPDFSALLKEAMFASARTGSEEKHKLLAKIVAERLLAQTDDLLALSSKMAARAVENLTPKQLRLMGLTELTYSIRPHYPVAPDAATAINFGKHYMTWLTESVSHYLPMDAPTLLELRHLDAVGCINYFKVTGRDMRDAVGPSSQFTEQHDWPYEEFVNGSVGTQLQALWEAGIAYALSTTVGKLVGTYVHEEITGERVEVSM